MPRAAALLLPRRIVAATLRGILAKPSVESCGLMIGCESDDALCVHALIPCENLSTIGTAFIISPHDYSRVARSFEAPMRIVGVYHSHFGSARPSDADKRSIRLHDFAWLIIGNTQAGRARELEYSTYVRGRRQGVASLPIRWQ